MLMSVNAKIRKTTAEVIAELERLSAERLEALREAGIEPFVEKERSAEEQRRARRVIYEWRKRRLETRTEDKG
jgi:hypothetical protein